ncbi:MAG: hypothetical protein LBQ93_06840 [Treponema sp.]|jgi:hypothetical protein|nr:hypothetical protein [Treponema sp.]
MKTELNHDGYEKIDRRILEIENAAYSGMFTDQNTTSLFQRIVSEVKLLRQTLREELLLVPDAPAVSGGKGDAA